MAISQLLFNSERCGFRFCGSIDVIDSVKLPSVIFGKLQDGDIQDVVLLLSCTHATLSLSPQLHSITILEDNRDTFRFTTRQPLRIHCPGGRRLPEFKNLLL